LDKDIDAWQATVVGCIGYPALHDPGLAGCGETESGQNNDQQYVAAELESEIPHTCDTWLVVNYSPSTQRGKKGKEISDNSGGTSPARTVVFLMKKTSKFYHRPYFGPYQAGVSTEKNYDSPRAFQVLGTTAN
jgi:hypothetical protein